MTMPRTLMASEISEQPDALSRTLERLLPLRVAARDLAADRRHVLFLARGTSDNAAVYGRYLVDIHTAQRAALGAPSLVTHYQVSKELSDTLVVSLSQSGATEEIVAAQRWAARCGARTVAITNVAGSPLAQEADLAMTTAAGDELAVPATKSYTAQLLAVAVLADALGSEIGELEVQLRRVPRVVRELLDDKADLATAVELLASSGTVLAAGRGLAYGTALEVALKLEETCLQPVRGLSYADLRHGPIAVIDPDVCAILVAADRGPMLEGMLDLASELSGLGARVLAIGGGPRLARLADVHLPGPDLEERLAPLGLIVPGQRLVESFARHRGLDPDRPRSLSKITRTDRRTAGPR
jgi:glucosamine--fructose-6-phosphate aminotransferase (isomerizing)